MYYIVEFSVRLRGTDTIIVQTGVLRNNATITQYNKPHRKTHFFTDRIKVNKAIHSIRRHILSFYEFGRVMALERAKNIKDALEMRSSQRLAHVTF